MYLLNQYVFDLITKSILITSLNPRVLKGHTSILSESLNSFNKVFSNKYTVVTLLYPKYINNRHIYIYLCIRFIRFTIINENVFYILCHFQYTQPIDYRIYVG